jgi:hypothetical protein
MNRAERRFQGESQWGDQSSRHPALCESRPVVQCPAIIAGRMGDQPAQKQLPIEERRRYSDRLHFLAGRIALPAFVEGESIANGVERGPKRFRQSIPDGRTEFHGGIRGPGKVLSEQGRAQSLGGG